MGRGTVATAAAVGQFPQPSACPPQTRSWIRIACQLVCSNCTMRAVSDKMQPHIKGCVAVSSATRDVVFVVNHTDILCRQQTDRCSLRFLYSIIHPSPRARRCRCVPFPHIVYRPGLLSAAKLA